MTLNSDTWSLWEESMLEKISTMEIMPKPYPYYYVDQFFPREMYDLMLQYWPREESFWGQGDIADEPLTHKEANFRKIVLLEDAADFHADVVAKKFWEKTREILLGKGLVEVFVTRCLEFIKEERPDKDWSKFDLWSDALLQSDREGYQLGPHHDSNHALFSNIIYLPDMGDDPGMGTIVYRPKPEFKEIQTDIGVDYDNIYHEPKNFDAIYKAPYKANCMFGFINSPRAFHGLDKIDKTETRRRNILWSITLNPKKPYKSVYKRLEKGNLDRLSGDIEPYSNESSLFAKLIKLKGI